MELNKIYLGDCLELMEEIPENSIDVCITDPPYELNFMNKGWDASGIAFQKETWQEVLRILKPGGHLLAFGGSRTYHRVACAIEDAGFEIRDMIEWVYGSGFPKSLDISKQIDKTLNIDREKIGKVKGMGKQNPEWNGKNQGRKENYYFPEYEKSIATSPEAKLWDGWGTGLKPAHEPICIARKPISEKNIAQNVLKWGTGGINIDATRIEINKDDINQRPNGSISLAEGGKTSMFKAGGRNPKINGDTLDMIKGRFPANLIHDGSEEVMKEFNRNGETSSGKIKNEKSAYDGDSNTEFLRGETNFENQYGDSGTPARFFYCAKASKSERDEGLYGVEKKENLQGLDTRGRTLTREDGTKTLVERWKREPTRNHHPTVKPLDLMKYLVTMFSREGQTVLDPFAGSGTTLIASHILNRNYIGIEKETEYYEIAQKRLEYYQSQGALKF